MDAGVRGGVDIREEGEEDAQLLFLHLCGLNVVNKTLMSSTAINYKVSVFKAFSTHGCS